MNLSIDTSGASDVSTTLTQDRLAALKDTLEDEDISKDQVKTILTELASTTTGASQKEEFGRLLGLVDNPKAKTREIISLTIRTLEFLTPATGGRRSKKRVSQRTSRKQTRRHSSRHLQRRTRHLSLSQPTRRR